MGDIGEAAYFGLTESQKEQAKAIFAPLQSGMEAYAQGGGGNSRGPKSYPEGSMAIVRRIWKRIREQRDPVPYIPWPGLDPDPQVRTLRWLASRGQFGRFSPIARTVIQSGFWAAWPVLAVLNAIQNTRRFGDEVRLAAAVPPWRQFAAQLWLAFSRFVPPDDYYHYALYKPGRAHLAGRFLHASEIASLNQCLSPGDTVIQDKLLFEERCRTHGIPTAPILAELSGGTAKWRTPVDPELGPGCSLFVKTRFGFRGEGAEAWDFAGAAAYWLRGTATKLPWPLLARHLESISRTTPYLVQPLLKVHPALARLTTGALCTVRTVTGRDPAGKIHLIAATFKTGWRDAIIDTHGPGAPVDLESGRLGRARTYRPNCPGYLVHPQTQAPFTGTVLPGWEQIRALAIRTHEAVPGIVFAGWDIALTQEGPVVLEGNSGWDARIVQKPQDQPLTETPFVRIAMEWIKQTP
ncbi:MAG: hypothetical protein FJW39_20520 [Acidobacteria bacterium]|nr:hypothetical protein [Acidobacteriota bacterium]